MKSSSAAGAVKTVIHWLRWTAVLGLVYAAWGGLAYDMYLFALNTVVVVAGATIAPRARLTTAIVLGAAQIALAFRNHVLAVGGPWWSWTINYTHFTKEALGAVLGLVYIFWLEKANGSVPGVPPAPPPPSVKE